MRVHVTYLGLTKLPEIERAPVVEIPEGSTLSDLYRLVGINQEGQGSIQTFVNNDASWQSTKLKENDKVTIVSIVTGG